MRVLNVGGGKKSTPIPSKFDGWEHVLLDIFPGPDVDIVADAREMVAWIPQQFDAVYSAHNLEHYHDHEVGWVLEGMHAALIPGGEVHIVVPNIGQLICEMVEHRIDLEDVLYMSPAGEITPLDVLFGYRPEVESGNPFYAHKTGFTAKRLHKVLEKAGFKDVKVVADLDRLELEGTGHV